MNSQPSISFAITACNEHVELERLLKQIIPIVKDGDEIIIQVDTGNCTPEVSDVITKYAGKVTMCGFPLNGHFANFKNNLKANCTKDYIFQIDADEELGSFLLLAHDLLAENPNQDLFVLSRINTVKNIDPEYVKSQGWNVDYKHTYNGEPIINWPDLQLRLFKNIKPIKWSGKVHEKLVGYKSYTIVGTADVSDIDANRKFSLIHEKTFTRQIAQNNFYKKLIEDGDNTNHTVI